MRPLPNFLNTNRSKLVNYNKKLYVHTPGTMAHAYEKSQPKKCLRTPNWLNLSKNHPNLLKYDEFDRPKAYWVYFFISLKICSVRRPSKKIGNIATFRPPKTSMITFENLFSAPNDNCIISASLRVRHLSCGNNLVTYA